MKGVYVLIIEITADVEIQVGALGTLAFKKGFYVYVGSAQNNLEKRVQRHLRKEKRLFWHVDYLLNNEATKIVDVRCKQGDKTEECKIASWMAETNAGVAGFGCSDCRCKSHLFYVENIKLFTEEIQVLNIRKQKELIQS
ncbi:MAG: GIY-YIG nuclease family protein [Candidatus Bathyarchaeota archaeon]|nr:GIY-YIG nuclease family protein [Candidatus Bathyarchaeota archaeon]